MHTIIDLGTYRLLVMQNITQVDGASISENLKLQLDDVGGSPTIFDKIMSQLKVIFLTSIKK